MLTLGFLALSVGLVPLAILFALGRVWTLEVAFMRLAWVPLVALALQVTLWRPLTQTLGYGSIVPPLLTCVVSLFFGVVGATLLGAGPNAKRRPQLLRSTMLASVPGVLLVAYIVVAFVRFLLTS
jgi:hypothetical protein